MVVETIPRQAILLSLLGILACATTGCPKYFCKGSDQHWMSGQCIFYDKDANSLYVDGTKCDDDQVCPTTKNTNSTCQAPKPTKTMVFPGDKCGSDRDCLGTCSSNLCTGTGPNEACDISTPCEPGYYCDGICKKTLEENEVCEDSFACFPSLGCFYQPGANATDPGKCKKLYSLEPGEELDHRNFIRTANQSTFCKYLIAFEGQDGTVKCADALKSSGDLPVKCSEPGDFACPSTKNSANSEVATSFCGCGMNAKAQAYCSLFPGDKYYKDWLQKYAEWRESPEFRKYCSSYEFDSIAGCPIALKDHWNSEDVEEIMYYYLRYSNYPELVDSDSCVLKVFQAEYVMYKEEYDDNHDNDDSALVLLLSGAAALGVIG